jgi:hypothetical protein
VLNLFVSLPKPLAGKVVAKDGSRPFSSTHKPFRSVDLRGGFGGRATERLGSMLVLKKRKTPPTNAG